MTALSLIQRVEEVPSAFQELTRTWGSWSWGEVETSLQQGGYLLILAWSGSDISGALFVVLNEDGCDVVYVYTPPEHRQKGIATQLLARLELFLKHVRRPQKIFLEVSENNHSARKLYESFGMHVINVRKNYYKDGSNALVFRKEVFPA